jgi:hypothetical protein
MVFLVTIKDLYLIRNMLLPPYLYNIMLESITTWRYWSRRGRASITINTYKKIVHPKKWTQRRKFKRWATRTDKMAMILSDLKWNKTNIVLFCVCLINWLIDYHYQLFLLFISQFPTDLWPICYFRATKIYNLRPW